MYKCIMSVFENWCVLNTKCRVTPKGVCNAHSQSQVLPSLQPGTYPHLGNLSLRVLFGITPCHFHYCLLVLRNISEKKNFSFL